MNREASLQRASWHTMGSCTISNEYLCILPKGVRRCARVSLWIAHLFIRFGITWRGETEFLSQVLHATKCEKLSDGLYSATSLSIANTTERAMTRGLLAAGCTSRIDGTGISLGEPWTGAEGLALEPDAPGHQAPWSRGAHFSARKSPIRT